MYSYNPPRAPFEGKDVKLYRYMGKGWVYALRDSRLRLAAATSFNDIFDCTGVCGGEIKDEVLCAYLKRRFLMPDLLLSKMRTTGELAKLKGELEKQFAEDLRYQLPYSVPELLCFAGPSIKKDSDGNHCLEEVSKESDILMWSHYADKWEGVRLGFELKYENHEELPVLDNQTPYFLAPVQYGSKRPSFDLSNVDLETLLTRVVSNKYTMEFFGNLLLNKSVAWSYESEWRMLVYETYSEHEGGCNYWRFNDTQLKTIDYGPRMKAPDQRLLFDLVASHHQNVEVRKAIIDEQTFSIKYETCH